MQPSIQALKLPALQGYLWMTEGVRLVLRNPAFSITASLGGFMITMVLMMLPVPVNVISYLLWPTLTLCILNCFRVLDIRQPATPDTLISGFTNPNIRTLFMLGGFYFITALVIKSILILLDLPLPDLKTLNSDPPQALSKEEGWQILRFALVTLLLNIPFFMLSWFAPSLAGWRSISAVKAMFFSLIACTRNILPLIIYAASLALLFISMVFVLALFQLFPLPDTIRLILSFMPIILMIPVFFAGYYLCIRDIMMSEPFPRI